MAQYDTEEFHINPMLPDSLDAAERVPPRKLSKVFEALRIPDGSPHTAETLRRSVCRAAKLVPASMARAIGLSVAGVKEMHPRFIGVFRDRIYCTLLRMVSYNNRRRGGGHPDYAATSAIVCFAPRSVVDPILKA